MLTEAETIEIKLRMRMKYEKKEHFKITRLISAAKKYDTAEAEGTEERGSWV